MNSTATSHSTFRRTTAAVLLATAALACIVTADARAVCLKAMATDPSRRYAQAADLARDLDNYRLSPAFDDVFLAKETAAQVPVGADFGGLVRLQGFDRQPRPVVRPELVIQITTYWQALTPLDEELRLVFYFWNEGGRLLHVQPEESLVHWYPTWLWEPGEQIKVALPPMAVGDLPHVGVAVLRPGAAELDARGRVVPITSSQGQRLGLWDQETVVELVNP